MEAERERSGPAGRRDRRILAMTLLRTLLTVAAMVVVYYLAPLDRNLDLRIGIWLGAGLVALGVGVGWQVHAIKGSETPRLRAVETVAVALPFLLLFFAAVYALISHEVPGSFTEALNRTDALYFTMTVFSTVGFGDITPNTDQARIITMVQMVVGLSAFGIVAKLLFGAVQHAVSTRDAAAREREGGNGADGAEPSSPIQQEQPRA